MRNLFALVGAGTIAFAGLGWYFGWYNLSRQPSTPGTQTIKVDLHPNKITTDVQKGAEQVGDIIEHFRDNNTTAAPATDKPQEAQPPAPGPVQPLLAPPLTGQNSQPISSSPRTIQPVGATAPQR
jgi:hypothetical protein